MAERRRNALTGDWVIVSRGRIQRPWQGARETPRLQTAQHWCADCYLCPRNGRAGGAVNPDYPATFAFDNDFPALGAAFTRAGDMAVVTGEPLFERQAVVGRCRVLVYSPRHDATLATLSAAELDRVVSLWQDETSACADQYAWLQVFENKGELMGCSSPHPHGQLWATSVVPTIAAREDLEQARYANGNLLVDYAARELALGARVVTSNSRWLVVVPFWATWPFETLLLPRRHRPAMTDLDDVDRRELVDVLAVLLSAYDRLFDVSFPYSMGWHGRGRDHGLHWQLHAHFYPPLLRSAEVRKFMVGYEMLAEAQRDFSPETAASRLRGLVRN
jgi:UDPglucose--hexose-1-phosphate uridylyltransferase